MEYEYVEGYNHENAYSDTMIFDIDPLEKRISVLKKQTLIAGENNSQYIAFKIPRYVDGIDLSTKNIQVLYIAPGGHSDINKVINVQRSDEDLLFGWVVPGEALPSMGVLTFSIEFASSNYLMKVRSIEQEIVDGLSGTDIAPEPVEQAWYIEIQQKCETMLDDIERARKDVQASVKQVSSNKEAIESLRNKVMELKKSGRDGREDLAAAITEKGVETAVEDNMHKMADNVRKIPSGVTYGIVTRTVPYTYGLISDLYTILPEQEK